MERNLNMNHKLYFEPSSQYEPGEKLKRHARLLPTGLLTPLLTALLISLLTALPIARLNADPVFEKQSLRVGVVYREAPEGKRMVAGIQDAIKDHNQLEDVRKAEASLFPYPYEQAGLRVIRDVFESGKVDVILGPSDSSVFLDLVEFQDDLEERQLLVLSPVVIADIGNDPYGWLFRANVQVNSRAQVIYDYLARRGFGSISVVYEAASFGDSAEEAFRSLLNPRQQRNYSAMRYRDADEIRYLATKIEAERPSAVGLFGSRNDMITLNNMLSEVEHGLIPYDPLLFTVVDASSLCMTGVLFLSLSRASEVDCKVHPREMQDEVTALGYDTTTLLLREANEVAGNPSDAAWRSSFRDQLIATMSRPTQPLERTRMVFSGMENRATPVIKEYRGDKIESVNNNELGWWGWIESRLDERKRRFGLMPLLNLLLVIGIVASLSFLDVRRSHTGGWWRFVWRWTFLKLALFNVVTAVSVFVFLAEFGDVRWDNWVVALSVAFGYAMLLKATLFETNAGQAVGFADFYERVLENIRRKLMVLRFELEGPRVYFLSYTNSRTWLRQVLWRVYKESEDPKRASELIKRADDDAEQADTEIGKRRIYAQTLLDLMNWRQIVHSRLVPVRMKEYQIFDPAIVMREAAEYSCNHRKENKKHVGVLIQGYLKQMGTRSKKDHDAMKMRLEQSIAKSTSEQGRMYQRLDWLVVNQVISIDQLWQMDFVDRDYRPPLSQLAKYRTWMAKWLGDNDAYLIGSSDPMRERRRVRRVPSTGVALLSAKDDKSKKPKQWSADLQECSSGGFHALIAHGEATPPAEYESFVVEFTDGSLAGLTADADIRGALTVDDSMRLCMEWVALNDANSQQISSYITSNTTAVVSNG
jgi:hypothetical protein